MTDSKTKRLMLALTAQVVLCLSVAPALAARLSSDPDTHQTDPTPKPDAAFQAARDAANIRPEEANDREHHSCACQFPGLRNIRAKHVPRPQELGNGPNLPDNGELPGDWSAPEQFEPLLITISQPVALAGPGVDVGTFFQPTGPPAAK